MVDAYTGTDQEIGSVCATGPGFLVSLGLRPIKAAAEAKPSSRGVTDAYEKVYRPGI